MEFPIAIHKEEGSVYGVSVPDVPGCHSWGNTLDEAIRNTKEAIVSHIETLLDIGEKFDPTVTEIEILNRDHDYADAIWAFVDIDITKLSSKPERFNVSWPKFILEKVDAFAESRHETRSGFLARAAIALIEKEQTHA